MAHLVYNERLTYGATLLNTLAVGCVVVGILTPVASAIESTAELDVVKLIEETVSFGAGLKSVIWLFSALGLHVTVQILLGSLRE
jgi:hypothetical protein